jgi:hypothetical protein
MCYTIHTIEKGWVAMSTTFTLRIEDSQKALISEYAAVHGKSMAEFMLDAALDVIEDAIDLRDWKAAKAEFDNNPVTYTAAEIAEKYL